MKKSKHVVFKVQLSADGRSDKVLLIEQDVDINQKICDESVDIEDDTEDEKNDDIIAIKKNTITAEALWKDFKKIMPEHRFIEFVGYSLTYHKNKDNTRWIQSFCLDGEYEDQDGEVFVECVPWTSDESLYQEVSSAIRDYGTPRQRPRLLTGYFDRVIFKSIVSG